MSAEKITGNEQSKQKTEAVQAPNVKATELRLPRTLLACILPPCTLDAGHRAAGFNVFPAGF
jgi:hypothetical protein